MKLINQNATKSDLELIGYVDYDFVSDSDKRRSLIGYVFLYGPSLISWKATLQSIVALSTTEAEYIALSEAVKEGLWLKILMKDFGIKQSIVKIYCDNQSTILLLKNSQYHSRTKHIDIKFHFIRAKIEVGEIEVLKVQTSENAANMLTKLVSKMKLQKCFELVGFNLPEK